MKQQTSLPLALERAMIKLLDGATLTRAASLRVQTFLCEVVRALGSGNPLKGQRRLLSIIKRLDRD